MSQGNALTAMAQCSTQQTPCPNQVWLPQRPTGAVHQVTSGRVSRKVLCKKEHPALKAATITSNTFCLRQTPTEAFKGELTMTRIPMTSSKTPGMKNARPRLRTNALFTADLPSNKMYTEWYRSEI